MKRITLFIAIMAISYTSQGQDIDTTLVIGDLDSLELKEEKISPHQFNAEGFLAGNLFTYTNWQDEEHPSFSGLFNLQLNYSYESEKFQIQEEVFGELGFQTLNESVLKYADYVYSDTKIYLPLRSIIALEASLELNSQFMPSYNGTKDSLISNFLEPLHGIGGVGLAIQPLDGVSINFSFLSSKVTYAKETGLRFDEPLEVKWEGGSVVEIDIDKELAEMLTWRLRSTAFINWVEPQNFTLSLSNRFSIQFNKFFKFMISTELIREPYLSRKLQIRNGVIFGVYF